MENQYLIKARLSKLWTEDEASEAAGVTTKTYRHWEAGDRVPNMTTLRALCDGFGETPDNAERLGYILERSCIHIKPPEDPPPPKERVTTSRDSSASSGSGEPLKLSRVQRIGKMVFLTLAIPSAEFQAAGQESPSDLGTSAIPATLQTPASISLQPLTSSPSQSVSLQDATDGEASAQKPGVRNLRDSSLVLLKDFIPSLKAYSTLHQGEVTTCQQQTEIYKTIEQWSTMDNEHSTDSSRITRRDLISLASISFPLLANIRQRHLTASIIEDFLSEATTSVTTCWHLLQRSDGLPLVEFTLPQYLPELVEVVKSSSLYRRRASYLAAQGFLLCSIVSYHHSRFPERVEHCQEAVSFADEAGDPTLLVASLEHLSDAFRTNGQVAESFPTYLQAKQYSERIDIAGFLRSRVRSGLSLVHAKQGESEEVIRFVDEASTTFTEADDETPVFLRANHGRCVIILRDGLSTLDLGNHARDQGRLGRAQKYWKDAAEKLGQIEQLPSSVLVPARIAAEIEIARALAYALAGNMEGFITAFEKGARLAKELGSEKRKQEAREALNAAIRQWRGDQRITGLWELLV